jgi:protein phosphatase
LRQDDAVSVRKEFSMTESAALQLEFAGLSDVGRTRSRNEDSFDLKPEAGLAVVCDGMGGHAGGDIASRTVIEVVVEVVLRDGRSPSDAEALIRDAVRQANHRLVSLNHQRGFPEGRGMGTTVVGFWRVPGSSRALVFHAGDSRLYRLRAGELRQLTRDHSLYQAWLDAGGHGQAPHRNIIVRALGTTADADPDIRTETILPGDLFLICSDGLSGMVPDQEIADILGPGGDLPGLCRRLVDCANGKGGHDNVTVVLARAS